MLLHNQLKILIGRLPGIEKNMGREAIRAGAKQSEASTCVFPLKDSPAARVLSFGNFFIL